jgi:septum site-determining protein MinC
MAFVVAPEPPLETWLAELDSQLKRSPGFFDSRPVILDFAALTPETAGVATLLPELDARHLCIIDVENAGEIPGADPWKRPLVGGRATGDVEIKDEITAEPSAPSETSLIIEEPVRSGKSIIFPKGDVTVLGAVASGAEILAGGSIHIYGALRGRAIAGALGTPRAKIFCQKLEAELVSIDGYYKTADDMDPALRGRAVQVSLADEMLVLTALR